MSTADLVPFLPLPTELLRDIMEVAAHADIAITGLSLALVSKVVNSWVTPIIYRTVVLDTRERILSFNSCIEAAQCASIDNSRYVLNLAIRGNAVPHFAWSLSICRDVQRLLLRPQTDPDVENSIPLWPRPRHVTLLSSYIDWIYPRQDFLAHTTHLYLAEGLSWTFIHDCVPLSLTHICIGCWEEEQDSEGALSSVQLLLGMPSMTIVMIHAFILGHGIEDFFGGIWVDLADIEDDRLIVAPGMSNDELLEIFESGRTVWDIAEVHNDWRQKVRN